MIALHQQSICTFLPVCISRSEWRQELLLPIFWKPSGDSSLRSVQNDTGRNPLLLSGKSRGVKAFVKSGGSLGREKGKAVSLASLWAFFCLLFPLLSLCLICYSLFRRFFRVSSVVDLQGGAVRGAKWSWRLVVSRAASSVHPAVIVWRNCRFRYGSGSVRAAARGMTGT